MTIKPWVLVVLASLTSAIANQDWTRQQAAHPDSRIILSVGLNAAIHSGVVNRIANEISDPQHARFRKHLQPPELQAILRSDNSDIARVQQWLQDANVSSSDCRLRGNVLRVSTTVGTVETLLNATYHEYTNGERTVIRTESYHVPDILLDTVTFISPTTAFPFISQRPRVQDTAHESHKGDLNVRTSTCGANDNTTPTCIRQVYNITYTAKPNRTTFAIYATEAASFSPGDLQTFLKANNPQAAAAHATYMIVGSGDPANGSPGVTGAFETALDTQTALGLAWPARGILYNVGGVFGPDVGDTYDPFVQFLQDLLHNTSVPSVVSFSESLPENRIDPSYAASLCTMMMHVGLRGVTLLFSSGNNGPNGDTPSGSHKAIFEPEFPASCPWVLSVGGTTNLANETAATQQTLTSPIDKLYLTASGGGFSNYFPAPAYQSAVASAYIAAHVPAAYHSKSGFNASGRSVPDVSAFSTKFPVVWNGLTVPIGGTSASTPLWASVIALLNDYEAEHGRPPLGFVNPWLYSLGAGHGLRDIVTGGNSKGACNLLGGCTLSETDGYDVAEGYDPVTGLGSPMFGALVESLETRARGTGGARKCEDKTYS
nr:tripeptidyl-peptidase sed2 [Quercus suber]